MPVTALKLAACIPLFQQQALYDGMKAAGEKEYFFRSVGPRLPQ